MKVYEIVESKEKLDEWAWLIPGIIAGARVAGPWLLKQGARLLAGGGRAAPGAISQIGTGIGRATTGIGIAATGLAINDIVNMVDEELIPLVKNIMGSEVAQQVISFAGKYGLPILAAIAILYGGKKIISALIGKGQSAEEPAEAYSQKDGDYARPGKIPAKKKRGPHPLGGKLVGETSSAGATSAGAVATVANVNKSKKKSWKPTDNALDMTNTSLFGTKMIKR